MTQTAAIIKFKALKEVTAKHRPQVTKRTSEPFASSAAKYYPALKNLASK